MSSVTKTLDLLAFFSVSQPQIGLSQLCRLANRDKATTYRHLQALEDAGFVEQDALTKLYRLGPAVLHLAHTREQTVPRKSGAQGALRALSDATGETSHVGVLSGTVMHALASCESHKHSTRVIIDIATFPLHATSSGLCALAFGPENLFNVACQDLRQFTSTTLTSEQALQSAVDTARNSGFAQSDGSFESDAHSISAPVFDQSGRYAGSVAVACVATRMTPDLKHVIQTHLITASHEITRNWGGAIPDHLGAAWENTLSHPHALEPAS